MSRLAIFALIALAGCSRGPEVPKAREVTVRLSSENPQGNAPAIAAFFKKTCLDASGDQGAFDIALQSTGWEVVRLQSANAASPINGWQVDHGQLYQSLAEVGRGQRLIDCHIALDPVVSPSVAAMRAALRPLIRDPSLRAPSGDGQQVRWRWRPRPDAENELTVGSGPSGLALHFSSTPAVPQAEVPAR
jgi:hypothetical protein